MTWLRSVSPRWSCLARALPSTTGLTASRCDGLGASERWIGVAVELAVGRGAEVVLHVARAAHFLGLRGAALELGEQRRVALVQDVHERVEAAAMGHADHDFLDAELAAALQDLLEARDQRFAAVEAEALGADELQCRDSFSRPSASTTRSRIMRRPSTVKSVRFSMCSMRSWIHAFWSGSEMCMYSTPILPQ